MATPDVDWAVALIDIDIALDRTKHQSIVTVGEFTNDLLDIRNALTAGSGEHPEA